MHCINFIYSFILFSIELRIFFIVGFETRWREEEETMKVTNSIYNNIKYSKGEEKERSIMYHYLIMMMRSLNSPESFNL